MRPSLRRRRQAGQDRGQRTGHRCRARPPPLERRRPQARRPPPRSARRRSPAAVRSPASCPASDSENGPGIPGGGTGKPVWAVTASNTTPSHGFRSRRPHTDAATRPPGRSTRYTSAGGPLGLDGEHEALPAEHGVVGAVGLVDVLQVAHGGARRWSTPRASARTAAMATISATTSDSTTLAGRPDPLGGGQAGPARPAGQLEDGVARLQRRPGPGGSAVTPATRSSTKSA